jgi:hypothetical protein
VHALFSFEFNLFLPIGWNISRILQNLFEKGQVDTSRFLKEFCVNPRKALTKRLNTQRAGPTRLLPGLAEADLIFLWIGMVEYIPC